VVVRFFSSGRFANPTERLSRPKRITALATVLIDVGHQEF
jgi:hypothetical protein